jgi:hypothetical protein
VHEVRGHFGALVAEIVKPDCFREASSLRCRLEVFAVRFEMLRGLPIV